VYSKKQQTIAEAEIEMEMGFDTGAFLGRLFTDP